MAVEKGNEEIVELILDTRSIDINSKTILKILKENFNEIESNNFQ